MGLKKTMVVDVTCSLLILLFVYASISKLLDYSNFKIQLSQSPLLSAFSEIIAWTIPLVEIVVALLLLTCQFRLYALYASFSLMVLFTAYIIAITSFSDYIPCSCGGILESLGWKEHLLFNIAFLVLTVLGTLMYKRKTTLQGDNNLM